MNKMKSGAYLRQQNMRQNVRVQADFEHYTLIAGIILGACFGLMFGFGW